MAVKIVTDSTADLPPALAKELDITVIPLNVHFGEETFLDGVDLDADRFYQRLTTEPQLPTTSQPSPGRFLQTYRPMVEAGHQVVSIHISSKLSGTLNSAMQAKEQLGDVPLEIVDSYQATMGLGLIVIAAARAVGDGASYEDVLQVTRKAIDQVQLFGLLDTLEYLQKGGRIGKVRGFVGSLLRIRPIVTVREGIVHSVTSVRSRAAGIQYMVTLAEERSPLKQAAVMYSTTPEEADELAERVRPLVSGGDVIQARMGPVLGTYVGPGTIGVVLQSEKSQKTESV